MTVSSSAPKGRLGIAQGGALGTGDGRSASLLLLQALKGRHGAHPALSGLQKGRGKGASFRDPRPMAWAIPGRPFGAEEAAPPAAASRGAAALALTPTAQAR